MSPHLDRPASTSDSTARQSSLRHHGVNTSASRVKGSEPDRPVTLFHRDGWAWLCPICATSATGYLAEHHARTIADEHVATHQPDLAGASTLTVPSAPARPVDVARRQAEARARLAAAVKEMQ